MNIKKVKKLERLTVNWYPYPYNEEDTTVNVVLYNGEYYCIDDPSILKGREDKKVNVRVISEVSSEEELYKEYARNIAKAPLNPYALYLAYKQGNPIVRYLPNRIQEILADVEIPSNIIEALNKHIMHYKVITAIDIGVLKTIESLCKDIEEKYRSTEEVLLDKIIEYLEMWMKKGEGESAYPDPETMLIGVRFLLEESKKKKDKEKEEEEGEEIGEGGTSKGKGKGKEKIITIKLYNVEKSILARLILKIEGVLKEAGVMYSLEEGEGKGGGEGGGEGEEVVREVGEGEGEKGERGGEREEVEEKEEEEDEEGDLAVVEEVEEKEV